ncbi:hypothetical protein [Flavisphingomonas formosensis]|uniref:hypothetical protein n=1 Tax=Flavisphingomonas formosensis TaxID=861534 RepID=UPI0012FC026A|nr:hypothetical protein [Sphingomonas formosensis]
MLSGFFNIMCKGDFPIADIEWIKPLDARAKEADRYPVKLRGNRAVELFEFEYNELMHRPIQIMPAETGTNLVSFDASDPPMIFRSPIIGWALCLDGRIRPVIPIGVVNPGVDSFVEMRGGGIAALSDAAEIDEFASADEMLQHFVGRYKARKAETAAQDSNHDAAL